MVKTFKDVLMVVMKIMTGHQKQITVFVYFLVKKIIAGFKNLKLTNIDTRIVVRLMAMLLSYHVLMVTVLNTMRVNAGYLCGMSVLKRKNSSDVMIIPTFFIMVNKIGKLVIQPVLI